ncbi:carcinine transporter-like [Aricia agestis]|uniref:carcinine transporter-like n=1 Tax=Aricia agestis TaxID=91739 RepID=UPI001C20C0EB|nr:carcinine transporter-like [Aricia agestis]
MGHSDKQNQSENSRSIDKADHLDLGREVDYDELLSSAGEFGRYQVFLFISTFPFYVFGVFAYFSQLFLTEVSPNHWCWIPELENLTDIERRQLAIPSDASSEFGYSRCSAYVANWTEVLSTGHQPNSSWSTQSCQYGWEFNKTEIPYATISSELGWVCERNSYQATAQSIFFIGSVFGGFLFGWVADRFGRLPAATISNVVGCVAGVLSIFTRNLLEFSLSRLLMGISYDACMNMAYLLVLEYVAPKYRTIIANLPFAIFYTAGAVVLPWIALACDDWKILSLVTSVPMALSVLAHFIVPESPRWLLSKGKVNGAIERIVRIGQVNKKEVPQKLIEQFKASHSKKGKEENVSFLYLLRRPLLRKMFISVCLEYTCCMLIFDALVRSIGGFGFDFFLSFTFLSMTECPSLLLISFILDYTGRKWLLFVAMVICSIFSVMSTFIGRGLPSIMCAVIARFFINMSCNTCMQWAAEMLPTPVRGSGVSIVHICSFLATIISPYVVYLENFVTWLPLVIIGCVALLGAVLALLLPETVNRDMPQTFDEAETLIKTQKFFDVPCLNKKVDNDAIGHVNSSFELN